MSVLENYRIENLISMSMHGLVFKGVDLNCEVIHVRKYVVLKFIWNKDLGREEAERLIRAQSISEVCSLITYDEVTGLQTKAVLAHFLERVGAQFELNITLVDSDRVSILVQNLASGTHLIDREPYQEEVLHPRNEWLVNFYQPSDGREVVLREWVTESIQSLSSAQRLQILLQLTRIVVGIHDLGLVHGGLHPWNLFYNARNNRLYLVDFSPVQFGVQGWQAPEHHLLATSQIEELVQGTDIYLIGKWMSRLLPKRGPWKNLRDSCLLDNAEHRPAARALLRDLNALKVNRGRAAKRFLLAVSGASLFFFWNMGWWEKKVPPMVKPNPGRLAVLHEPHSEQGGSMVTMLLSSVLGASKPLVVIPSQELRPFKDALAHGQPLSQVLKGVKKELNASFLLIGGVERLGSAGFAWRGRLCSVSGECWNIDVRDISYTRLVEKISKHCFDLLGVNMAFEMETVSSHIELVPYALDQEATILFDQGDLNVATHYWERAIDLLKLKGKNFYSIQVKLAECLLLQNRFEESRAFFGELLEKPASLGAPSQSAILHVLMKLAFLEWRQGHWDRTIELLDRAESLDADQLQDHELKQLRLFQGNLLIEFHGMAAMEKMLSQDRDLLRGFGNNDEALVMSLLTAARHHIWGGREKEARNALKKAQYYCEDRGLSIQLSAVLRERATFILRFPERTLMEGDEIESLLERARDAAELSGSRQDYLAVDYVLGLLHIYHQKWEEAAHAFRNTIERAQEDGDRLLELDGAIRLVEVLLHQGDSYSADELLQKLLEQRDLLPSSYLIELNRLSALVAKEEERWESQSLYLKTMLRLLEEPREQQALSGFLTGANLFLVPWPREEEQVLVGGPKKWYDKSDYLNWIFGELVVSALRKDDVAEAGSYFEQLSRHAPEAWQTLLVAARYYYAKGDYSLSYQALLNAREKWPNQWQNWCQSLLTVLEQASKKNQTLPLPLGFKE